MTYPGTPSPTPPEIYILPWGHAPPLATARGVPVPCTPDRRKLVSFPLKVPLKAPRAPPPRPTGKCPRPSRRRPHPQAPTGEFFSRHVAAVPGRCACAPVKAPVKDPPPPGAPLPPVSLRPADARPQPSPSPPSQLGGPPSPGEGKRRWHHPPTRGPAGAGLGPGPGRRPPPAQPGAAHSGPRDTHMAAPSPRQTRRRHARIPWFPACAHPATRGRLAPAPARLARSCLSTYSPTLFWCQIVNLL
jgi:hypothetical protein